MADRAGIVFQADGDPASMAGDPLLR